MGEKLTSSGKIVFITELPEINSVVAMTMLKICLKIPKKKNKVPVYFVKLNEGAQGVPCNVIL